MSGDEEMYSDSGFKGRLDVVCVRERNQEHWPGFWLDPVLEHRHYVQSQERPMDG